MGLQVVGAGLGRTGTASLKIALEQLGMGRCYHMGEVAANLSHAELWLQVVEGKLDWNEIFDNYGAAVDYPTCNFWEELAEYYPESKIILTVRDANDWFDSVYNTIMSPKFLEHSSKGPLWEFHSKIVLRDFGDRVHDRDFMVRYFEDRNELIKKALPAERLLVYEVKDGWEPLCAFLGVSIPTRPYPRVNTRKETEKIMEMITSTDPTIVDSEVSLKVSKILFSESESRK